ncbi:MAG: GNAT family N-acetyltransferase [Candidatus Marinimicrobia bacterium]|nr:GNAT family N-acetyltransferase [Candidatus Neomarinimicrobiota bacterium]MBT7185214.1 GNAT family N-acetyltransferase [Candidatus Neomarinimicrobiota bacterium]
MSIQVKIIQSSSEMEKAFQIRTVVFVEEQKVPMNIEMDEFDKKSIHILAKWKNEDVGTARWRKTSNGIKLERFAVLKNFRNKQIGTALVKFALKQIEDTKKIYLNAQESVIKFYHQFGFIEEGSRFYEANISHKKMVLKKK